MSRDGSGVYSAPPGTTAVAGNVITSAMWNALKNDIAQDLNLDRPIVAGGTGASTAAAARTNLGVVTQTSTIDTTAGSLMLVGAFGLGSSTGEEVPGDDCDLITRAGFYFGEASVTLHMPTPAINHMIIHLPISGGRAGQIATRFGTQVMYHRNMIGATWSDWAYFHSVIETATNANGTYWKYSDGRIECQHFVSDSLAISTGFVGGFRSAHQTWTFPKAFTTPPRMVMTPTLLSAASVVNTTAMTETQGFYAFTAFASQSADTRTVNLFAYGS